MLENYRCDSVYTSEHYKTRNSCEGSLVLEAYACNRPKGESKTSSLWQGINYASPRSEPESSQAIPSGAASFSR